MVLLQKIFKLPVDANGNGVHRGHIRRLHERVDDLSDVEKHVIGFYRWLGGYLILSQIMSLNQAYGMYQGSHRGFRVRFLGHLSLLFKCFGCISFFGYVLLSFDHISIIYKTLKDVHVHGEGVL